MFAQCEVTALTNKVRDTDCPHIPLNVLSVTTVCQSKLVSIDPFFAQRSQGSV